MSVFSETVMKSYRGLSLSASWMSRLRKSSWTHGVAYGPLFADPAGR